MTEQQVDGFNHLPALDGLRGLAVLGVIAYHNNFDWASGGFLGVSAFFTLSGFLITTLLLDERWREGRVSLRSFWVRRLRRLAPASILVLALIGVAGLLGVWSEAQSAGLRLELPAAALNLANWQLLNSTRSYAALFSDPSPVHHFWSLAIEEQFYLLFPPVLVLGLRLMGTVRGRLIAMLAVPALASLVWTAWLWDRSDLDRVYLGTDTRIAELLAGAILAVVVFQRHQRIARAGGRALQAGGLVALVALLVAWSELELADGALYHGGLLLHAALVSVVLLAVMIPGPLASLLSVRPLAAIGRISYGLYLLHWPIHVLLTPERLGLGIWPTAALRLLLTLVVAMASYRLIEHPIRRSIGSFGRRTGPAFVTVAAVAVVALAPVLAPRVAENSAFSRFEGGIPDPPVTTTAPGSGPNGTPATGATGGPGTSEPAPAPPPIPSPSVLVVGDSVAHSLVLEWYRSAAPTGVTFIDGTAGACGTIAEGEAMIFTEWTPQRPMCGDWRAKVNRYDPDLVIFHYTLADLMDRRLEGRRRNITEAAVQSLWQQATDANVATARASGASIMFGAPIRLAPRFGGLRDDRARYDVLNMRVRAAAAAAGGSMLEVQSRIEALGITERSDGVHLGAADNARLAASLLPEVTAAAVAARDRRVNERGAAAGGVSGPAGASGAAGASGPGPTRPLLLVGPAAYAPLADALEARGVPVRRALADCRQSDVGLPAACAPFAATVDAWRTEPGTGVAVVLPVMAPAVWGRDAGLRAAGGIAAFVERLTEPETRVFVTQPAELLYGPGLPAGYEALLETTLQPGGAPRLRLDPPAGFEGWATAILAAVNAQ